MLPQQEVWVDDAKAKIILKIYIIFSIHSDRGTMLTHEMGAW